MCCKRAIAITSKPLGGREMSRSSDIVSQLQRRRAERKKPKVNSVLMKVNIDDSQLGGIVTAGENKPPPTTLQKTGGRNSLSLFFSIGLHVSLALLLGFIYIKDRITSEDDRISAALVAPEELTMRERTNIPVRKRQTFEAEQQEIEIPLDTTVVTDTNLLNPRDEGFTLPSGHGTDFNTETPGLNDGPRVIINPGRIKSPVPPTTTVKPPKIDRPPGNTPAPEFIPPGTSSPGPRVPDFDTSQVGNEPPKITKRIKPVYPKTAKRAEKEGTVKLQATIGTDGIPKDIVALTKLGFGFEDAAINALKKWRFIPGKKKGKDAEMTVSLEIKFELDE